MDDQVIRDEAIAIKERLRQEMTDDDDLALELRAREWARENVIERVLLLQAAKDDQAPIDDAAVDAAVQQLRSQSASETVASTPPDPEPIRAQAELQLRMERLFARITANVARPTLKEVSAHYQQNRNSFATPELIRAAHIVKNIDETNTEVAAQEAIRQIDEELRGGGKFEEIADRYSDCPGRGGDLGYFTRGQMVEEFEIAVFSLRPGETSPIFRTPFGFHIAKLLDRKPAGCSALNDVRENLEQMMWNERKQRSIESFIDALRARAEVRKTSAKDGSSR